MIALNDYIRFTIIFFIAFTGNALLMEIPLMPFLLLFVSIILYKQESLIDRNNFLTLLLLTILFVYFFSKNLNEPRIYDPLYLLWPIYLMFFLCLCGKKNLFESFHPPLIYSLLLIMFFLIGSYIFKDASGRAYFIFVANVLYRLFLFLSLVQIIHSNNFFTKVAFFIIGLMGVFFTGSRMGLLLAIVLFSLYFLSPYINGVFSKKAMIRLGSLIPIIIFIALYNLDQITSIYSILSQSEGLISRLLLLSGGSISIRIQFLSSFIEHLSFFGAHSQIFEFFYFREYFPYPHNIIAELILYYGFFGLIISLIILFEYAKTFLKFIKKIKLSPIEIAFLVILPSSLASGDIVDGLLVLFFSISSFLSWISNIQNNLYHQDKNKLNKA